MKTSLLISTYNWPEALELVFKSLSTQTRMPDEILIADDGSGEETATLINDYKAKINIPLKHIWHKDEGFRRTFILNKAIAASKSDYIIQIDGDCIMHKNFVEDHIKFASENMFLYGSRVNILEKYIPILFSEKNVDFPFFSKGIKNRTRNLHIPFLSNFYTSKPELSKKLRGCNLSFWRKDFIKVNGYNEDMTGWGKEDSEFAVRLLNSGISGRRLRYRGIVYHIWHKIGSKSRKNINEEIQKKAVREKLKWCENGVDKYLKNFKPFLSENP